MWPPGAPGYPAATSSESLGASAVSAAVDTIVAAARSEFLGYGERGDMTTETRPPGLVGGGETGGRPLPTATNKMSGLGLGMVAGMGIGAIVILVVAALALAGLGPNLGGANARMRTAATTEKAAPANSR